MAVIPGGVKVAGFISPSDTTDEYPVIDPVYGIGGFREVPDIAARDAIPALRRRHGMLVLTQNNLITWQLNADLLTWRQYNSGSGGGGGGTVSFPFRNMTEIQIPGISKLPTLTVWLEGFDSINFNFNTYLFGGATFNQVQQIVMQETKDYTATFITANNTLRINFIDPQSGEIVYAA
jgi:hypothetical protein